jgi:hypothetical protein
VRELGPAPLAPWGRFAGPNSDLSLSAAVDKWFEPLAVEFLASINWSFRTGLPLRFDQLMGFA